MKEPSHFITFNSNLLDGVTFIKINSSLKLITLQQISLLLCWKPQAPLLVHLQAVYQPGAFSKNMSAKSVQACNCINNFKISLLIHRQKLNQPAIQRAQIKLLYMRKFNIHFIKLPNRNRFKQNKLARLQSIDQTAKTFDIC